MTTDPLIGTVWRDRNWHTLTVTAAHEAPPGTQGEEPTITLTGTIGNCTPFICPWCHEGTTVEVAAYPDEVAAGVVFGFTRQDVFDADPERPAEPVITDDQRRRGLEFWDRMEHTPDPDPAVVARERQAFIDAGIIPAGATFGLTEDA